jgi:hypothetical protein
MGQGSLYYGIHHREPACSGKYVPTPARTLGGRPRSEDLPPKYPRAFIKGIAAIIAVSLPFFRETCPRPHNLEYSSFPAAPE